MAEYGTPYMSTPGQNGATEFRLYKREAIKAAKELGYSAAVVEQIKNAKTDPEIDRIMRSARERGIENDWYDSSR